MCSIVVIDTNVFLKWLQVPPPACELPQQGLNPADSAVSQKDRTIQTFSHTFSFQD